MGLVIALWMKKLWAYPLTGIVIVLFALYQVYLLVVTHSLFQLFLTILDVVILLLLRFEYRRVVAQRKRSV